MNLIILVSSVQFSSVAQLCLTLCDPMDCSTPSLPVHHQLPELLKLMSIESVILSDHLILFCPLLLLPSIFPSIRVFSNESVLCIKWPKYWSFSFSISPSNEYSELISFRMDWLDLLAIQGILKSLLQHHSSKASILRSSAFFIVQLSHPYMTTGKTIALNRQTFVGKVMSLLFTMLSRLVIVSYLFSFCPVFSFDKWGCMHAKLLHWCPTLCDPIDCSLPGSVHGILQARILKWVAMPSSKGTSQPRDRTRVP